MQQQSLPHKKFLLISASLMIFHTRKKNDAGVETVNYTEFLPQVIRGKGHYDIMQRFGLYHWHTSSDFMLPVNFRL
jgi:hypothetical protein